MLVLAKAREVKLRWQRGSFSAVLEGEALVLPFEGGGRIVGDKRACDEAGRAIVMMKDNVSLLVMIKGVEWSAAPVTQHRKPLRKKQEKWCEKCQQSPSSNWSSILPTLIF